MYCLDKALQDILKSKLLINTNHTNVKPHAHRQTDTRTHNHKTMYFYIYPSLCVVTKKNLWKDVTENSSNLWEVWD